MKLTSWFGRKPNSSAIELQGHSTESSGRTFAMLGAFCLFLSALEYMIPKPLPFLRIGLANLPLMLAVDIFTFPSFLVLVCIKVFGHALISGTLFSYVFLFSLAGTLSSAMLMFALRKIFGSRITFIGIGSAGAMVSNAAQLALAWFLIFKDNVLYIAPPFFAAGLITGIILGIFCEMFTHRSQWYQERTVSSEQLANSKEERTEIREAKENATKTNNARTPLGVRQCDHKRVIFGATVLFATALILIPSVLFNPSTEYRVIQFLFFWLLVIILRKKSYPVFTIITFTFIVAFNLLIPYGRVLFSFGPFKITEGALKAGIHRAATLEALIMLSKVFVREDLKLPGTFGKILGESLQIFSVLMSRKPRFMQRSSPHKKSFSGLFRSGVLITYIDELMLELSRETPPPPIAQKQKTSLLGYLILAVIIVISWGIWSCHFYS